MTNIDVYYRFCYPSVELNEMADVLENLYDPIKFSDPDF